MSNVILSVEHLTKRFGPLRETKGKRAGGFTAVNDISFNVKEGEIVGLLGPNGAGKTTTIFMLLDLISPTVGKIRIFGKEYKHESEYIHQNINYCSTYVELPPRLTVFENLLVMGFMYEVAKKRTRIHELADTFGVTPFLYWQYQKLSAGQKTRVSLCKAFLNEPKLLLLDEPTASLDPDIAQFVRKEILSAKKQGMTVLITSHNMSEVEEVCDRVLFIHHGKIVAEDTPEGLANGVRKARIHLMMKDGQKRTLSFARKAGFPADAEGRFVTIEIDEQDIAYLLAGIAELGVSYSEVSIDKPTLEEYFIEASKEEHI